MNEKTGWNFSPLNRTLSPIGATALLPPMKTKEKVEQGKRIADHWMPLGYLFSLSLKSSNFCPNVGISISSPRHQMVSGSLALLYLHF